MNCGPAPAARGRDGRWVRLGEAGVDSAHLCITDPAFASRKFDEPKALRTSDAHATDFGSGIEFMAGFGDGTYEIWGWLADYGAEYADGWSSDFRIAQVVVTMIDEQGLREWHEGD